MARQLIQTVIQHTPLNLSVYKDTYQDNLKALVERKLTGQVVTVSETETIEEVKPTPSLMEALKASIRSRQPTLQEVSH